MRRIPSLILFVVLFVSACCANQSASANNAESRETSDVAGAETLGKGGEAGTFPVGSSGGCRLKDATFVTIDAWPLALSNGISRGCHYLSHDAPYCESDRRDPDGACIDIKPDSLGYFRVGVHDKRLTEMGKAGMGMTIVGIVLSVVGGGLVIAGTQDKYSSNWIVYLFSGSLFVGPTGLLFVIIGAPMWAVGHEDAWSVERVSAPHPSSSYPSSQRLAPRRRRDRLSIEAGNLAIRLEERGSARLLVGQGIGVGW